MEHSEETAVKDLASIALTQNTGEMEQFKYRKIWFVFDSKLHWVAENIFCLFPVSWKTKPWKTGTAEIWESLVFFFCQWLSIKMHVFFWKGWIKSTNSYIKTAVDKQMIYSYWKGCFYFHYCWTFFHQILFKTQFKAYLTVFLAGYYDFNFPYLLILLSTSVTLMKSNFCEPVRDAGILPQFFKKSS